MTPLLEVEDLGVRFAVGDWPRGRWLRALHEVSLTVRAGEVVALVGESGSGKSTLARAVAGLLPTASGSVRVAGAEVLHGATADAARRRIQMVFQDPYASINPAHPAGHGVARALLLHGRATPATVTVEVERAFAAVGLGAELALRAPQSLSGGQRQRVAIARALAAAPDVLLADEPTSMLDVSLRAEVLDLIAAHARTPRANGEGRRAVVLVTHDLASAWRVADRAVVLYAGQVMEDGPASDVLARPRHPYAQLLVAAARRDTPLASTLPARAGSARVIDPGPGCPFAGRCIHALPACRSAPPARIHAADEPPHVVRCSLSGVLP